MSSEFIKGADWSNLSYRELQNELTVIRSKYRDKMDSQTQDQREEHDDYEW